MELFVGNISYEAKEADLKNIFLTFGAVSSVVIVTKKKRKKSRGFGFIDMPQEAEAKAAMAGLDGKEFMGRVLKVIPALPQEELKKTVKANEDFPRHFDRRPQEYGREQREPGVRRFKQDFRKGKEYRGRPHSGGYARERDDARTSEPSFRPRYKDAAARPAGEKRYAHPWRKQEGESKPWKRSDGRPLASRKPSSGARPWKKPEAGAKPWIKAEKGFKPWRNESRGEKPWERPERPPQPWKKKDAGFKPWQKKEVEAGSWKRPDRGAAPWRKPAAGAPAWKKSEGQSKPRRYGNKAALKSDFGGRRNAGRFKR